MSERWRPTQEGQFEQELYPPRSGGIKWVPLYVQLKWNESGNFSLKQKLLSTPDLEGGVISAQVLCLTLVSSAGPDVDQIWSLGHLGGNR